MIARGDSKQYAFSAYDKIHEITDSEFYDNERIKFASLLTKLVKSSHSRWR